MGLKSALVCAVAVSAGTVFGQGSLIPPGAPAATMKTLDQLYQSVVAVSSAVFQVSNAVSHVESRTDVLTLPGDATYRHVIAQPGSYYLSSNLTVTNMSGIVIRSPGVTLDLNGFCISGNSGAGIAVGPLALGAVIRNGSVSGFWVGVNGLYVDGDNDSSYHSHGVRVENMVVAGASANGSGSQGAGIQLGYDSCIVNCLAVSNQNCGVSAQDRAVLINVTALQNAGDGIYVGYQSVLKNCIARQSGKAYGIFAEAESFLDGCVAIENVGTMLFSYGIAVGNGSTLIHCSAIRNSNTNFPAYSSSAQGIHASGFCRIEGCTAYANRGAGIAVGSRSTVSGNSCFYNGVTTGGAGIMADGWGIRIEDNCVQANGQGVVVVQSGNMIVRNAAMGNATNWNIAASNVCLVVKTTAAGAISGDSGGTAPGATDPNANFTY